MARPFLLSASSKVFSNFRSTVGISKLGPVRRMCEVSTEVRNNEAQKPKETSNTPPKKQKKRHHQAITIAEIDPKSGYGEDDVTDLEALQLGRENFDNECSKIYNEWRQKLTGDFLLVDAGDRDKVWEFDSSKKSPTSKGYRTNPEDYGHMINPTSAVHSRHDVKSSGSLFDNWIATSDSNHNEGYSVCSFVPSIAGHGLFVGHLNTKIAQEGIIDVTGFCNISAIRPKRSFDRKHVYDWADYTHLVIRLRGDGRTYMVNLGASGFYDLTWNNMYHYPLYTRGGPHWQTMRIPFSKFYHANRGVVQDKQTAIHSDKITQFGITVADQNSGPFRLEIDYIAVEYDPSHTEEFAYEMYHVKGINT